MHPGPWRDRWLAWRERRLRSAAFRRAAAALPLTRPVARRSARAAFDLVAGFVYSQVLFACVRLGLFERLADRPQTLEQLAPQLGLSAQATQRLVAAAVSLQLLEARAERRFGLGVLGAPLAGNTGLQALIEHHAALYADLRDPVALLRGELPQAALAAYWPYADEHDVPSALSPQRVAAYSALMAASQPLIAEQVLDAYSMRRHRCVLDVGGGAGAFLQCAAARWPHLRLMLFDLPAVAEAARARLDTLGLAARTTTVGGDFFADELPDGADLVTLLRVVHDHDDARVLTLLSAVRRALPPHGALLLAEPMAGTPGAEPMGDAYFGFYLWAMGRGRARTVDELTALLREAGFGRCRLLSTAVPLVARVLLAQPS
jgi:demethylspheroidene O-methyltransferase